MEKGEHQARLEECESEDFAINLGKKLKKISILNELTPQVLHSLVDKLPVTLKGMCIYIIPS